ncbi:uncharacterized protein SPPG_06292 [Spizellomyces punctatus DAOM BR117]|uniref:Serine aminopeptidase S33 domain-containing protein n=1 Tax=Spizellomyces punctatus (strain DAOM BR117) TaxID=645134 RepID=A0A0L0HCF5_SPIPD|nr:uncharacterized protein SPPG_06292 [Spizellomyces punctatus DAOM BR117]KNC98611.1 hypothetical protein SPPG_06292 [Spizellomyces punctatus DAOM BR117]|eukprot:XP_016606651.1 hypothetical protein SPPG_06292 [Spizellomyces punctatus DAOM BR117]
MANITEEWVKASDGVEIYHRVWEPTRPKPLATVVFVHGVGEHICRYDHVFKPFAEAGIKVRSFDQRGFGKTGRKSGILGHNEGYDRVLKDVDEVAAKVRVAGVPHFVFGHSMGGGIALRYAIDHQNDDISGLIASAPLVGLGAKTAVSTPEYYAIRAMSYFFGTVTISNPVDPANLTRDPTVNKAYVEDPLVHPYTSLSTARDIVLNGEALAGSLAAQLTLPLLITFGTGDHICSYDAAKAFCDAAASKDKTFKSYTDLCHELHNEPEKDEIIKFYIDWILERAKKA